jgi:hypothetical protein
MDVGMPRPTIGKKKAKLLIQTAALVGKKRNNPPVTPPPINGVAYAVIGEKNEPVSQTYRQHRGLSCQHD